MLWTDRKEARVKNKIERNNNDVEKKPSTFPQSNGPKFVNSSNKVEKSNSSHKVDENSNHRKSSATVRLTNNGNVPHEVSINDAPIVKKSVVSVEEVTRNQGEGVTSTETKITGSETGGGDRQRRFERHSQWTRGGVRLRVFGCKS